MSLWRLPQGDIESKEEILDFKPTPRITRHKHCSSRKPTSVWTPGWIGVREQSSSKSVPFLGEMLSAMLAKWVKRCAAWKELAWRARRFQASVNS
jgi:hypothetical protein